MLDKYLQATCFLRSKYPKYIRSSFNFIEKLENVKGEKEEWKEKGERIRTCFKMGTNLNRYFPKDSTSMFSKYMKLCPYRILPGKLKSPVRYPFKTTGITIN